MSSTPPGPSRRRRARPPGRALAGGVAALGLVWGVAAAEPARTLRVPLHLDDAFLRARLIEQLFTEEGERTPAWRDASGCTTVVLSEPTLVSREGAVHVGARFEATLGAGTGGFCLGAFQRQGLVDAALVPRVAPGPDRAVVAFRVADSELRDADDAQRFTGAVWEALRGLVHPHLETLRLDLGAPVAELRGFLPALLPAADARARRLFDSLALEDVAVREGGIDAALRFEAPAPRSVPERAEAPEPALTSDELARWEAAWQSWDAFLTFLIKHSLAPSDESLRRELRATLLDARHELTAILAAEPTAVDPVRPLFVSTWQRLAPLLRRLSTGLPGEEALHWATLIAAADVVAAIDALGPDLGIELSRDGLRRMARMVVRTPDVDPTTWSDDVDPELRSLFGFGPPLAAPEPVEEPSEEPPPGAEEDPPRPRAGLPGRGDLVLVANPGERDLDVWIPRRSELDAYLERVRDVLEKSTLFVQRKKRMPGRLAPLYRALALSTAWQETCWRQYVRRGGVVRPITSKAGALGIMQVNPHVWRGFYDVGALRTDIRYNADAGGEILHHYLVDHAIAKREDEARGQPDDLARATYAAYNAGPRQLARYRRPRGGEGGVGHRVDADFWSKFQAVRAGKELEVKTCYPGFSA